MLTFDVAGDKITRTDKTLYLAAGSKEYTPCLFAFSDDWESAVKTAFFHRGGQSIPCLLTDDACHVPEAVLTDQGTIRIGVVGVFPDGHRVSSALTDITVKEGAYSAEYLPEPEPGIYDEIMQNTAQSAQMAANAAESSAQAQHEAERAAFTAQEATDTANKANATAESAKATANNAEAKAGEAVNTSLSAATTANNANNAAEGAVQTAKEAKRLAEDSYTASNEAYTTVNEVNQRMDLTGSCKPGETMTDAFPDAPRSLLFYGNSTQNGVPAPAAPIQIQGTNGANISSPFLFTVNFPVPLHGIKNTKGVYAARDIVDFTRGVIHRECAVLELNGTEKWSVDSTGSILAYRIAVPDAKLGYATSICTHFVNKNYAWAFADKGIYSDHDSVRNKYFRFDGTMDEWKAYLAAQKANGTPVTLIYATTQAKEEPLPDAVMEQYRALRHGGGDLPFTTEWNGTAGLLELTYTQDIARSIRSIQKALAIVAGGGGM